MLRRPFLLMTGDEDFRTPMSETEQYYAALKLLRVESALVRFPGEPHGLSRHPSHQIVKVVYTLNWFDAHRKKPRATTLPRQDRRQIGSNPSCQVGGYLSQLAKMY